jgi:acyl phosphate:glycerol-3-phosphate acyltransferase
MPDSLIAVSVGYFAGSIPFAFLIARGRGIDVRRAGSGNVGATNVLRTSGVVTAVCVMLLDMAKGAGAVHCVARLAPDAVAAPAVAGVAAVVGHIYPVWLKFRGGKGVATAAGVFSVLTPQALAPAAALFVLTVWITRFVSLGSLVATVALGPIAAGFGASAPAVFAAGASALLIVFRHRSNIMRLMSGTERRVGDRGVL